MNTETLTDIFNKAYERYELKKFIKDELFKAINEEKEPKEWVTIKGNHIPIFKDKESEIKEWVEDKQEDSKKNNNTEKDVLKLSNEYVNSLSQKQRDAISAYTDDEKYTKINAWLRGERGNIDVKTEKIIKELEKVLDNSNLSSDLIVYRGVGADFIEKALKDTAFKERFEQTFFKQPKDFELDAISNHFKGKKFTEEGFMSTSYDSHKAFEDKEIMLTVNLSKGTQAINVSSLSEHDEAEILVNKGYEFIISDVKIYKTSYNRARWNFILDMISPS